MQIVKGGVAGIAMKHKLGRVVQKFPPQVRISKRDKKRLDVIVSRTMSAGQRAARSNGKANGHTNGHALTEVSAQVATAIQEVQARLLTDEHTTFFKRVSQDERIPKDIRAEAFHYYLGE